MKTLDRNKSEELWNEVKSIEFLVSKLGGCVQNPDFVNEENAVENYRFFLNDYTKVIDRLRYLRENIAILHEDIIIINN